MEYFEFNGQGFSRAELNLIEGLRYGDGIFETINLNYSKHLLGLHFRRLNAGCALLQLLQPYHEKDFHSVVLEFGARSNSRVIRVFVFRKNAFFNGDKESAILFQAIREPVKTSCINNLIVFAEPLKLRNKFSGIKSCNYLPSVIARNYAIANNADEAIILNDAGNICESATSNLFMFKDGNIFTPDISEGCVAGVFRQWLMTKQRVTETKITTGCLLYTSPSPRD